MDPLLFGWLGLACSWYPWELGATKPWSITKEGKKWNCIFEIFRSFDDFAKPPASKNDCEQGPFFYKNHSMPIRTLLNNFVKEYKVSAVLHSCCM